MRREISILCLLGAAGCTACGPEVLIDVDGGGDGGFLADAGSPDGGIIDAGIEDAGVDAGPPDAGFDDAGVDAGVADAGLDEPQTTPCEVPHQDVPEFSCEPDADYCDPVDMPVAEHDVLATWSRFEGDRWIMEARFADFPLLGQRMRCFFGPRFVVAGNGTSVLPRTPMAGPVQHVGFALAAGNADSGQPPLPRLPPSAFESDPGSPIYGSDYCAMVFASRSAPVLRYVFASSLVSDDNSADYLYFCTASLPQPTPMDGTYLGDGQYFVTSLGGAADRSDDFVSICDLTCDNVGGISHSD